MDIIGRGMLAKGFLPYQKLFPDVIIFATGIANSQLASVDDYASEYQQLGDILHRCRQQNKRLLYFSSAGAVYGTPNEGESHPLRNENSPVFPKSAYGKHKLLCEAIIRQSQTRHLIIRLANLVGSAQNPFQLIPALREQIIKGEVKLYRRAARDIMDVQDLVQIVLRLLAAHDQDDLLLVTSGHSVSVVDLFETLRSLLGVEVTPHLIDQGDEQRFSIEKLRGILPDLPFSDVYYREVLSRYVSVPRRS